MELEKRINTRLLETSWEMWCLKWKVRNEGESTENRRGIPGGKMDWARSGNQENTMHFWNDVTASLAVGELTVWGHKFGRSDWRRWSEDKTMEGFMCQAFLARNEKNHWRFLSRTAVWLKVCQWKMNSGSCMYSCWERPILGRPIRKQMQWPRGGNMRICMGIRGIREER